MAFSLFGKHSQGQSLVLLVDIGSASVGGALAKIEAGKEPHILASIREDISFQDALSSSRFLVAMNRSLDQILKKLQGKAKVIGTPAQIVCTLSSPWFILKSRHLNVMKDEEFMLTERVLDDFLNENIELLKGELKETLPPEDVRIIEKKIVKIKLNGYEIKNPYNQKTNRMEVSLTVGISSKKVIENIERKLGNFFHTESIHFGAFPLAAFSAVRDIFPNEQNFVFLDITGESTDVSLANNDVLVGTSSFSRGKNYFIREISSELRTVHEEASSLFRMYLRKELDKVKGEKVAAIIFHSQEEWLTRFEKALASLSANGAISHKIFFTSDAEIAPLFLELMRRVKSDIFMNAEVDVQYLDQLIVANFVSFEKEVTRDPFIVIEALLASKTLHVK